MKGVENMYYENHEVMGTDLPIYKEMPENCFTLEDIVNTNQNIDDFEKVGFVEIFKYERNLYVPIYNVKGE